MSDEQHSPAEEQRPTNADWKTLLESIKPEPLTEFDQEELAILQEHAPWIDERAMMTLRHSMPFCEKMLADLVDFYLAQHNQALYGDSFADVPLFIHEWLGANLGWLVEEFLEDVPPEWKIDRKLAEQRREQVEMRRFTRESDDSEESEDS